MNELQIRNELSEEDQANLGVLTEHYNLFYSVSSASRFARFNSLYKWELCGIRAKGERNIKGVRTPASQPGENNERR